MYFAVFREAARPGETAEEHVRVGAGGCDRDADWLCVPGLPMFLCGGGGTADSGTYQSS